MVRNVNVKKTKKFKENRPKNYHVHDSIMESIPTEDPGPGNRPLGILVLATAAVSHSTSPS